MKRAGPHAEAADREPDAVQVRCPEDRLLRVLPAARNHTGVSDAVRLDGALGPGTKMGDANDSFRARRFVHHGIENVVLGQKAQRQAYRSAAVHLLVTHVQARPVDLRADTGAGGPVHALSQDGDRRLKPVH